MFRERIVEEKKKLGITAKSMSERSRMHTPEETISRVLSGKTADPGVATVLDLGETVGLAPYEIFMDSTLAAEFRAFLELKSKSEETEAERIRIIAENEELKTINTTLSQKIDKLEMQLQFKNELLELHDFYRKLIPNN
jgi:transcriptional regulator with XRE-family HTH domain